MTEAQALRVLGVEAATAKGGVDAEVVRAAFSEQMRMLRSARTTARRGTERQRIERAIELTLMARTRLLPEDARAFAVTQELLPVRLPRPSRHAVAVLLLGVLLLLIGLWPDSGDTPATEAVVVPDPAVRDPQPSPAASVTVGQPSRQWLEPLRLELLRAWQDDAGSRDGSRLPAQTRLDGIDLPAAPEGWRWQGQRDGAFALVAYASADASADASAYASAGVESEIDWLLAAPLLEQGELVWACFTARPGRAGCQPLVEDRILQRRLPRGQVDARLLAEALARLPETQRTQGWTPQRWYRQALRQGEPRAALALADLALASDDADAAADWLQQAIERWLEGQAYADGMSALRRLLDLRLQAGLPQRETLTWLQRCRSWPVDDCPAIADVAMQLEQEARSGSQWDDVRWWYQQAMDAGEVAGVEGLVRLLALGRTGSVQRRRALMLLEEAAAEEVAALPAGTSAERSGAAATEPPARTLVSTGPQISRQQAGKAAADLARIWSGGWGVEADQGEASWWAAQGARLGHVGAALHLASAFALGLGTARDMDRAREVVQAYANHAPVFEVAFYREVARRLQQGDGVEADATSASAWYRRAFEICRRLADAGNVDARFDLAGMYFSGHGVERDLAEAVQRYAQLTEVAPLPARNMLAWIHATAPQQQLRDGERALALARAVVEESPTPSHLDTLAAALAETGAYREAVATQQRALALLTESALPGAGGADVAERRQRLEQRLAEYRRSRPWRDDGLG